MTISITVPLRGAVQQQVLRPVAAVSPVTGPTLWADLSNWSGELTDQGCADLKAAGYVGIVVQAITGLDGVSWTVQQCTAAVRNGLRLQGYCWVFPNVLVGSIESRLHLLDGFPIEALWADIEQPRLTIADVDRDLAAIDAYLGRLTGAYSGRWFWVQQGWLKLTKWADEGRALWDSNYTGIAEVGSGYIPYGGWTWPTMTQFQGSTSIGSVHDIDLNVMAGP